ncbi:unnamed protein product [Cuscuta campestris]|uniref:GCF C-terminal domain-containing protein n=1 Tax=Cuscuta campestris TaxID=132261 RepID=A0A484K9X8_9ASTE|nr:unnamed protein product [Cuscuta campestris]
MLRFLESWEKLLPPAVLRTILDNVVLPKLLAAVDLWDPRETAEEIPIHTWIHPWLPLLGHKLETCYPTICSRLASGVLDAWHPSDESAYSLLSPWKTVFDPDSWEELMVKFIVSKLSAAMQELQVSMNPAGNQKPYQFEWVQTWATHIPSHHLLPTWDIFFNKWQDVLCRWLCSNPLFEEVTKWFLGWKNLLPKELVANEHIRYRLSLGLEMMARAAQGLRPRKRKLETQEKAQQHGYVSMREVIEAHAQYNGLAFKPKPGRIPKDGHQIYGFGNISVIIDFVKEKVFAQIVEEGRWSLVCLEQLLELHNQYGLKKRRR